MNGNTPTRVTREATLRWIAVQKTKVSAVAQRDLNQARVDRIAADFDPEELQTPTVNLRDGHYYIIDGQHRVEALKQIGWGDQQIQCWVYEGLSEDEEAEKFLKLNDTLAPTAYDKFKIGVQAGRDIETAINRIVISNGLCVSKDHIPGAIGAVGTLRRVFVRTDGKTLGRTLQIVRDAYGDPGMESAVIDGIGHLCGRYNGDLDDGEAIKKLSAAHGGVGGLLNKAEVIRRSTGAYKSHAVAAAAVEIINAGRGGKKLPNWWAQ